MPEEQNNQEQEQQVTQSPITSEDPVVTQSDLKRFYEAIKPYLNTVSIPNLDIGGNEEPVNAVITLLNNGNEVIQEPALNFKDFDISDDSENERTDIKPHRLSNAELQELSSDLPPAVNRTNNYSTEEQVIGTWIDGKPLYQKTVDCGTLPNNNSKQVAHNISNLDIVCEVISAATNSDHTAKPIPHAHDVNISAQIQLEVTSTNICLYNRGSNYSGYNAYVTLRYTKTTD